MSRWGLRTEVDDPALAAALGSAERSRNVDVLRAFAALAVLVGHAYLLSGSAPPLDDRHPLAVMVNTGASGVWLFFAISGYLISGPFVKALLGGDPLPGTRQYLRRRIARIYPIYLLAFTIVCSIGLLPGARLRWWQVPLHAALLHNLVPGEEQAILFASWTLTIEVVFYLFVPAAAAVARRLHPGPVPAVRLVSAVCGLWLIGTVWTAAADQVSNPTYGLWLRFVFPAVVGMFCPGILAAVAVAEWRRRGTPPPALAAIATRRKASLAAAAAVFVASAIVSTSATTAIYDLARDGFAVASGILLVLAITHREADGPIGRTLAWLGLVSYGIYLWQAVILQIIEHHGVHGWIPMTHVGFRAWSVHAVLLLAVTVPVAWVGWVVIEQPCLQWGRSRRVASVPPVATAAGGDPAISTS